MFEAVLRTTPKRYFRTTLLLSNALPVLTHASQGASAALVARKSKEVNENWSQKRHAKKVRQIVKTEIGWQAQYTAGWPGRKHYLCLARGFAAVSPRLRSGSKKGTAAQAASPDEPAAEIMRVEALSPWRHVRLSQL